MAHKAKRFPAMTPFGEHKRHGIERVFREQLSPAEDDGDESDGI